MTTPASMSELSTTAASNNPAGSDAPSTIDDQIRALAAIVRQNVTKGTDIASASAITIPASGNYFVVTGTTGITSITDTNSWYGREVVLKFSGALTITHSANLILPGAANITTVAGDVAHFVSESSGVWRCTDYTRSSAAATASGLTMATSRLLGRTTASTGAIEEITVGNGLSLSGGNLAVSGGVVQRVEGTPYTTYNSTSTTIPTDDTIPQNTEGAEWATVTITPKNASNRLVIEAFFSLVTTGTSTATACFALFQDSTANALAATGATQTTGGYISNAYVKHEMAAGTTSATTFKVRAGASSGNLYVNGGTSARTYGGIASVRISVTEISA